MKTRNATLLFLVVLLLALVFVPTAGLASGTIQVNTVGAFLEALNSGFTNIEVSTTGGLLIQVFADPSAAITIPVGTTVTFLNGGWYININCTIHNYGTIINNHYNLGINSNGIINNHGTFNNLGTLTNTNIINNQTGGAVTTSGNLYNNSTGTINNNGTFTNSGYYENSGNYQGNPMIIDNPVELKYGGTSMYYKTFQDAVAQVNNTGYELRILKDITMNGDTLLPFIAFTLSGAKDGGGVNTLTVNNGDFIPFENIIIKDIKLAHTGTSGGNFRVYSQGLSYFPITVTIESGVVFENLDLAGVNVNSVLNIQGDVNFGSNKLLNVRTVNINNGSTLTIDDVSLSNLGLSNGSTLKATGTDGVIINGNVNSTGEGQNRIILPSPTDHSGIVYSMAFGNSASISGTSPIIILPKEGEAFSNKSKLIYLGNNTNITGDKVLSGDPKMVMVKRTLDGKQYLTLINATSTALISMGPPITYGQNIVLSATVTDGNNAAVNSGAVKFYRGTSAVASNLLGTINVDMNGKAEYTIDTTNLTAIGDIPFYALYQDSTDFYHFSNVTSTISVAPKTLSISGVTVNDKTYDGTGTAELTGIDLTGIVGGDQVTASATAVFTDLSAGTDKSVNLSNMTLSGVDAGKYTIAGEALNLPTTAQILQMAPTVQLTAPPEAEIGPGYTVNLKAIITGAETGVIPSGSVTFYDGDTVLGTAGCVDGEAVFVWTNVPEGTYNLSGVYSGDTNYTTATGVKGIYTINKLQQAILTVSGTPATVYYGDRFTLDVAGGSGGGEISFAVTSGTSVSVDPVTGEVTSVGIGESVITVTKAGTTVYEPASTTLTISVAPKTLSISGVTVNDKTYDGTGTAELTGIDLTGIVGGDQVTASATAVFTDLSAGTDKSVNLSNMTLSGVDAGKYTIAGEALNLPTTAQILQMAPTVQLTAPPEAEIGPGYTVNLKAIITGAETGTIPSGSVTFYDGDTVLGTAGCVDGEAVFAWTNVPEGTYNLSGVYSGDTNYTTATGVKGIYTINKLQQAVLTVSGTPATVYYGDRFTLDVAGGSGGGEISFAVSSGTSVSVDPVTGEVTAVGIGESVITVTKAGTTVYEPVETQIKIVVRNHDSQEKSLSEKLESILNEAIEQNKDAVFSLNTIRDAKAQISPQLIQGLGEKDKSLIIQNRGLSLVFSPQSLLTNELVQSIPGESHKLEIGIRQVDPAEKQKILDKAGLGDSVGLFDVGGKLINLTAQIVDNSGNATKINQFNEPVAVTIDLSDLNLTAGEIANLTGVRYQQDLRGNIVPVKLGGSYDSATKQFTFYTDRFSLYSVSKANKLTKISFTIGSVESVVNNRKIISDVAPIIINNRTMVPVRFIAESMGANVDWVAEENKAIIKLDDKVLVLTAGQTIIDFDAQATIVNNRILVPLRYVAQVFNSNVQWFPRTKQVYIVR